MEVVEFSVVTGQTEVSSFKKMLNIPWYGTIPYTIWYCSGRLAVHRTLSGSSHFVDQSDTLSQLARVLPCDFALLLALVANA
eukprot:scaffold1915_cov144-Amphora_coffeaeformis.AAC.7